jgi:beta-galactosidase
MIWAWVDDAFQVPGRGIGYWRRDMTPIRYEDAVYAGAGHGYVGDCVWGVVDGWRRPRPEWELCRKVYSPVQVASEPLPPGPVRVPVFNQNVFENLSLYACRWSVAGKSGVARADAAPRSSGFLVLPVEAKPDDVVGLEFFDGERPVAEFRLPFKPRAPEPWSMGAPAGISEEPRERYLSGASVVYLRGERAELAYERIGGELMWGLANGSQVLLRGPRLHVLKSESPAGSDPAGWKFTGETHGNGAIRWNGVFGDEWSGGYDVRLDRGGNAEFEYEFTYRGPGLWVRELGLAFDLPLAFQKLAWERNAEYTVYPGDYIGRPRGTAEAHAAGPQLVPPGPRPIALDDHAWGTNDFRSAKRNIYWASLSGAWGKVTVVSDGTQTVRCALTPHEVSLRVLDFYGGSGGPKEWSVLGFHYGAGRFIKTGEVIRGKVRLRLG